MRPYIAPRLQRLERLTDVAKEVGRPIRTFRRQMVALHKADEANGDGGWLVRLGLRNYTINRSRLRQLHPEMFEVAYLTRDESRALEERIEDVEHKARDSERRLSALGARMRDRSDQIAS